MDVYLITPSGHLHLTQPFANADHAVAPGACPSCGASPWGVAGKDMRPSEDDCAWEADGYCTACRAQVGTIRAEPDTLFGVREDQAVLAWRCRVY